MSCVLGWHLIACSFCFTSRKELKDKEVNSNSAVQSEGSIHLSKIDPSRVVQLSWRPRSGTLFNFLDCLIVDYAFDLHFNVFCWPKTLVRSVITCLVDRRWPWCGSLRLYRYWSFWMDIQLWIISELCDIEIACLLDMTDILLLALGHFYIKAFWQMKNAIILFLWYNPYRVFTTFYQR